MFIDHLRRLEMWIEQQGLRRTWRNVMIAEERDVYDGGHLSLPAHHLRTPEQYEDRFTELLDRSYDWIHLNALGTLNDCLSKE